MIELTETLDKAPIQRFRSITGVDSRIDRVLTMGLRSARCESGHDPDAAEGFRHGGSHADDSAHARRDHAPDSDAKPESEEHQREGFGSDHRAGYSRRGGGEPKKLLVEGLSGATGFVAYEGVGVD